MAGREGGREGELLVLILIMPSGHTLADLWRRFRTCKVVVVLLGWKEVR